jgi:hypothetical protein
MVQANITDGAASPRYWQYTYDGFDRLIGASSAAGTSTYGYDMADNMVYNSDLCGAVGSNANGLYNMDYGPQGVASGRPHAPKWICSTANTVSYDPNGNTTSYDPDGTGPLQPRSFTPAFAGAGSTMPKTARSRSTHKAPHRPSPTAPMASAPPR